MYIGGPIEFQSQGKSIEGDPKGMEWLAWQNDMDVNIVLLNAVVDHGLMVNIP